MLPDSPAPSAPPSLARLFVAFTRIGLISFGGGISGLLYRDMVVARRWVGEEDFFAGLALAQAMPGVNVTNLAIWLGYKLRGNAGATAACLGIVVPTAILIVMIGSVLGQFGDTAIGATILAGIAAAALGMTLSMGARSAHRAVRDPVSAIVFLIALGGSLMHGSVLVIIGLLAPVSIWLAWRGLPDE